MHITPAYQAALDYIFSFVDFSKTHTANLAPENFDLSRMTALLERLNRPHEAYPSLHIAGTKGKGSTAAFCSSALTAAGRRTGLYTSPHLQDFSERIQVDGKAIAQEEVVDLLERLQPHIEAVPRISTFEIMTALAFQYFADRHVDAAVLEVGLGGRLDATNVVTPLVSVITSISMDHVPILGTTIAEIAGEKAGIIKPGVPVVVSPQRSEAAEKIRAVAAARGAPVISVGEDIEFRRGAHTLESQEVLIREPGADWTSLEIPLIGLHQVENAATAWAALRTAASKGLEIAGDAVARGFAGVKWPGRFEFLSKTPSIILDAAHNEDSARHLSETLQTYFPGRRLTVIFGASGDKAVDAFLQIIRPLTHRLIATRSEHPRAMAPADLIERAAAMGFNVVGTQNIEEALHVGLADLIPEDVLLITGSVFVVGAAREVWGSLHNDL